MAAAPDPPDPAPRPSPRAAQDLEALAADGQACTRCDLYKGATQAVFGRGPARARLILVGEQPGDQEDLTGAPFVGPAGKLLRKAIVEAGIDPRSIYLTNAVKHFKWEPRGGRRIHQTPRWSEVRACRPWLDAELQLVAPSVVVCLGAVAGRAMLGSSFRLGAVRGLTVPVPGGRVMIATYHPSAVLRARTPEDRAALFAALVDDLRRAAAEAKARPRRR
jgi:uracil-DNA glycosylase family protein